MTFRFYYIVGISRTGSDSMAGRRKDIPKGMPNYSDLINPTLEALQALGGSATINEIYSEVINNMHLSEVIIDFPHSLYLCLTLINQVKQRYSTDWPGQEPILKYMVSLRKLSAGYGRFCQNIKICITLM